MPPELPASEERDHSVSSSRTPTLVGVSPGSATAIKDTSDTSTSTRKRGFFRRNSKTSGQSSVPSNRSLFASDDEQDHSVVSEPSEQVGDWNIGDDVKMGLG